VAFDLNDHSIQEVKLDQSLFSGIAQFSLTKYKDNQILKFGDVWDKTIGPMVRITIESFERIIHDFSMIFSIILKLSQWNVNESMLMENNL